MNHDYESVDFNKIQKVFKDTIHFEMLTREGGYGLIYETNRNNLVAVNTLVGAMSYPIIEAINSKFDSVEHRLFNSVETPPD